MGLCSVGPQCAITIGCYCKKCKRGIDDFKPQELSNMAWAFATLSHDAPPLFDTIAKAAQVHIDYFKPQELSNTAWAYATLNHNAPSLFDAIAKAAQVRIDDFKPQELSNTAWSFATLNLESPALFDAIARWALVCIEELNPQALSNTAWAFAMLNQKVPLLFDAIARMAPMCITDFNPQSLSLTAWAFATLDHDAPPLFDAIAKAAQVCIDDFSPQNLSNTAWAFATLNVGNNLLTDGDSSFAQTLLSKEPTSFSVEELSQLHQYHLWCKEKGALSWFSNDLKSHCLIAFVSQEDKSSQLQNDMVRSLGMLQEVSQVQEEFCTKIGYSLDAVIVYQGNKLGVEVDGPSHFVGSRSQMPTGKTILKHQQLHTLEGWKLVSIPYWEWNAICAAASGDQMTTRESKKQAYLRNLLDVMCTNSR